MLRCIYCAMCEEACPKDAIWLRTDYEQASYDRLSMNYGKWDLMNTYADLDGKPRITGDPTPAVPRPPVEP
jgi:NADH-quinone oxidoreductase subunit I